MQGYQQRLIFLALFMTVTCAQPKIEFFRAYVPDAAGDRSTVYANLVQLWASVADCPSTTCKCQVTVEQLDDVPRSLEFEQGNLGTMTISNLEPNTNYTFILTCTAVDQSSKSEKLAIKTDHGRPKPPQNVTASLVSDHLQINWAPPISRDTFDYYRLILDGQTFEPLFKNQTSYNMTNEYEHGVKHIFNILTCYTDNQQNLVCSEPKAAGGIFLIPVTITSSPSTSTEGQTSAGHWYSAGMITIISSLLLLLGQME